jgi:hypothetical protein
MSKMEYKNPTQILAMRYNPEWEIETKNGGKAY